MMHLWWTEDNETVTTACGIEAENYIGSALDKDGNYLEGSFDLAKTDCPGCRQRMKDVGLDQCAA